MSESTEGADRTQDNRLRRQFRWFYALFLSPAFVFTGAVAIVYAETINPESVFVAWFYLLGAFLAIPLSILTHIGLAHETRRTSTTASRWWLYLGASLVLGAVLFTYIAIKQTSLFETTFVALGGYLTTLNISVVPSVVAYLSRKRRV